MYSDEEIMEVTRRMQKANSKHYKQAGEMIIQLEAENRMLREQIIAALELRLAGLKVDDVVKEGKC